MGEVWAARSSSGLTSVGLDSTGSPSPFKDLNAATFTLPRELGVIQESIEVPNSGKTVIHIQDAHCNYAAQKAISQILNYLTTEYGVSAVNCEGGKGSYDLSPFTVIEEKDTRKKVSDFFVKEGVVNAAEYFAVNNPDKVKLWGVEDADLYIKNLKIYRESLIHKSEIDKDLRSIGYMLDNLKRHIYPEELLELDNYYTKYKDDKVGFKEYITYLLMAAGKRIIDIKSYSNIYLLSQTLEQEEKINFKKANNEKDEVVDILKKTLSKNELEELIKKVGELKIERISQVDFYAYLIKKAKSIKLDLNVYPELRKYIVYISLYGAVDRTKIMQEVGSLEDKIKETLYQNDTQRELGILSKNLALEKNLFNISLTREDYTYYKEHASSFAVSNYVKFIDDKAPLYKISSVLEKNIGALDVYREKMDGFYECSLERDKAFIKNIKFTDHDRPNSIIITGGFHTQNLRELFNKEKVSYISIMPKFTNEKGYESPYLKRLAGQRTALENVIDTAIPAVLNLQVVNILSQLAPEVEGKFNMAQFKLAVMIVTAVTEGKDFIVKIAANVPIRDAKQEEDKVVIFSKGEGADFITSEMKLGAEAAPYLANIGAIITDVSSTSFAFLLPSQAGAAKAAIAPLIGNVISSPQAGVRASESGTAEEKAKPQAPAGELVLGKTPAELLYESAVNPAAGVASIIRRNNATRIVSLVASDTDKYLVGRFGQTARDLAGPDIHLTSYADNADKNVWMTELGKIMEIELKNFVEKDLSKRAPLMEIRIKEGKEARDDVEAMIKDILIKLGQQEKIDAIRNRIKLVQVSLEQGKQTNPAIEFFADMGMLECERYISGDYGDERTPPQELQDSFLTLLKLSIRNGEDFDGKNINEILSMIFAGHLLRIRPADFKSFDEWNKANRQLLQSV